MDSEVSVIIDRYFTFADSFKPNFLNLKLKFIRKTKSFCASKQSGILHFNLSYKLVVRQLS